MAHAARVLVSALEAREGGVTRVEGEALGIGEEEVVRGLVRGKLLEEGGQRQDRIGCGTCGAYRVLVGAIGAEASDDERGRGGDRPQAFEQVAEDRAVAERDEQERGRLSPAEEKRRRLSNRTGKVHTLGLGLWRLRVLRCGAEGCSDRSPHGSAGPSGARAGRLVACDLHGREHRLARQDAGAGAEQAAVDEGLSADHGALSATERDTTAFSPTTAPAPRLTGPTSVARVHDDPRPEKDRAERAGFGVDLGRPVHEGLTAHQEIARRGVLA